MDFHTLAAECAPMVAPQTLAAIVKTESAFRPYAININKSAQLARQPVNKQEAVITAKWLIQNGYNIDMGLGQINSANLPRLGISIENVFEPCINLQASATILTGNYTSAKNKGHTDQAALQAALSAYNTGNFTSGFNNGYVQRVLNNASALQPVSVDASISPIPLKTTVMKVKTVARVKPYKNQLEKLAVTETQSESVFANPDDSVMVFRPN